MLLDVAKKIYAIFVKRHIQKVHPVFAPSDPCRFDPFVKSFNYRSDDVVLVGYPKSGNTWLRFIMANLTNNFLPDSPQEVDWLRKQQIVPAVSKVADAKARPNYDILPSPRILHSHAVYTELFPKVIYIMRDGRDVMVSYYYHHKKFANFKGTFYEYLQSFKHRTAWHEHLNSWIYQNASNANMYVVRYEDLLQTPQTEVEKIVQFAGLNCTNAQIKKSIMNSTFDQLRRLEKAKGLGYVKPVNTKIPFIRKGVVGGWREEFGDKEKELFKKMCGDILIKANYERSLHW